MKSANESSAAGMRSEKSSDAKLAWSIEAQGQSQNWESTQYREKFSTKA